MKKIQQRLTGSRKEKPANNTNEDKNKPVISIIDGIDPGISMQERFLVNRSDILVICERYLNKNKRYSLLGAACTIILSALLSAAVTGTALGLLFYIMSGVFGILGTAWLIVSLIRRNKKDVVLQEIYQKALENANVTGIFLITRNNQSGNLGSDSNIQIMTTPRGEDGTPYIVYLDLKNSGIIQNGLIIPSELIKQFAREINSPTEGISIEKVGHFDEIKRTKSDPQNETMIHYVYFKTSIPDELRMKVEKKYQWKTIDELKNDLGFMSTNGRLFNNIYDCFLSNGAVHDSFDRATPVPIKIIWNITKKCGYDCKICATHRNKGTELTADQKARALINIESIGKDRIKVLDFSGGDPLYDADNWDIILGALEYLKFGKVSVTTTSKGIEKVKNEKQDILHDLLYKCEITVDETGWDDKCTTIREQDEYAFQNRKTIIENLNPSGVLTVNVPILDCKVNKDTIDQLVQSISEINPNMDITCALLRLMPSGRMSDISKYPTDYNPIAFVRTFDEEAKKYKNLKVYKHCALRCYFDDGNNCDMLTQKIGIDCEGNVFACAWAGYISSITDVEKNPFYLGNVYQKKLSEILQDTRAMKLKERIRSKRTTGCRLFNYLYSNPQRMDCEADRAKLIREGAKHA